MRQGRLETPPRFLKCCSFKCALACQRQPTGQFLAVSERSCLEKMVSDVPGALFNGVRIEPLDRFGDARVEALSAWSRDAGKQRLTDEFMGEGNGLSGPSELGTISPICCAFSMMVKSSSTSIWLAAVRS